MYLRKNIGSHQKSEKKFSDFPWPGDKFPWQFLIFRESFYLEHEMIIIVYFRWKL